MQAVIANMPRHWIEERKNSEAGQWDEMWNGVLHMPPMPNTMHQDFEGSLAAYLRYRWARPTGNKVYQQINLCPANERDWPLNYRVPDILLLTPAQFGINRGTHFAGAPLVVVEIKSPGDESYEKFPFYAGIGVQEVWVFDRDSRTPEIHVLVAGAYELQSPAVDGWHRSAATGVEFRQTRPGWVWVRVNGDEATAEELPEA
jgi:Uma2 family endonuclease